MLLALSSFLTQREAAKDKYVKVLTRFFCVEICCVLVHSTL